MNEWHHIETAPKDGTQIIAFIPSDHAEYPEMSRVKILSWREDDVAHEHAWLDDGYDDFALHWASVPHDPTHWMPLPSPPTQPKHSAAPPSITQPGSP